jgi:hypothetical protein
MEVKISMALTSASAELSEFQDLKWKPTIAWRFKADYVAERKEMESNWHVVAVAN